MNTIIVLMTLLLLSSVTQGKVVFSILIVKEQYKMIKLRIPHHQLPLNMYLILIVTSLDCWECEFKGQKSAPQAECLTSKTNMGKKTKCNNSQPGCSVLSSGELLMKL